jgi:hypothetical protein
MKTVAAPLPVQIAVLILGPPLLSALLWLACRLFVLIAKGSATENTHKRQRDLFWASLKGFYIVGCLLAISAWLR